MRSNNEYTQFAIDVVWSLLQMPRGVLGFLLWILAFMTLLLAAAIPIAFVTTVVLFVLDVFEALR